MPSLEFKNRTLCYEHFGSRRWNAEVPVFIALATEYRDTETLAGFYRQFPDSICGIILDNTNMGRSSRLDRSLTPEEIFEEIQFVCSNMRITRPVLIGYCSNSELALWSASQIENAAVVLQSPLIRWGKGEFIEFLYSVMKRPILEADAYTLSVIMNLVDPHSRGFREQKNYFLSDQFATAAALKDAAHFWIKTVQNKPTGRFDWDRIPEFEKPLLVMRGAHDPIQPIQYLRSKLTGPRHKLVEFNNSHRILDDQLEHVIAEMSAFAQALKSLSIRTARGVITL